MFRTTIITFLFSIPFAAQAQLVITGKVIAGETGLPLQGASVFADNTTLGTATNPTEILSFIYPTAVMIL